MFVLSMGPIFVTSFGRVARAQCVAEESLQPRSLFSNSLFSKNMGFKKRFRVSQNFNESKESADCRAECQRQKKPTS